MMNAGDQIQTENASWSFGQGVPESFNRHAEKSIPLYHEGHDLVLKISDYFLQEDSLVYDLGSSTGELLFKLACGNKKQNIRFTGIDREPGMIREAEKKCAGDRRIIFDEADIAQYPFEKCDMIIAYYTIQFIHPRYRQELINRIFQSLNWGGAFLLFEKVRAPDARFQDMMTGLYTDYKLERGYSEEEIVSKSRSLKGILEPFSSRANYEMLERAGFQDIMTVMKYICFEGILAVK